MTLIGRIPVEPLDEERMTNIERRVVAGAVDAAIRGHDLRAPHRLLARAAVAVGMVAAGAVGWALHIAPPSAPAAEPPAVRAEISPQRSRLDIGDATIESEPGAVFAVTRPAGGVLVAMTRGKVELDVAKRGARPPLIVRAGDTDVVVVGTHFTVDYGDGHGDVEVHVTEGVVRVVHQQQETRVAAGQDWRTHPAAVAAGERNAPPATGDTPSATVVASRASDPAANPVPAAHASGSTSAATPAPLSPDVWHDHKATVPDERGSGAPSQPPRVAGPPPRSSRSEPGRRVAVRDDPHVDLLAAIRAQPVEPALALGQPSATDAITKYYDIAAHQSGDAASQAFYSIAAVRYLKLGRNADALQTLDAYVRRFPGGKEYRAALWLRVRILCLDQIDDRCRAAAYTYLHLAPDDPAAHVAELITQTVEWPAPRPPGRRGAGDATRHE